MSDYELSDELSEELLSDDELSEELLSEELLSAELLLTDELSDELLSEELSLSDELAAGGSGAATGSVNGCALIWFTKNIASAGSYVPS